MADMGKFVRHFDDCRSTFRETSFDSSNREYLCSDESQEVINFDKLIESKYPDSNTRPKSFDAVYVHNELIFCIEFKNQKYSQINNVSIRQKLLEGKRELESIFASMNIAVREYDFVYCVAYRKSAEPMNRYKRGIEKDLIQFGLERYKDNGFVKEIFTNHVNFFTRQFKKQLRKELAC
jgi:hypothetical protein